jgi:hypothetical protein
LLAISRLTLTLGLRGARGAIRFGLNLPNAKESLCLLASVVDGGRKHLHYDATVDRHFDVVSTLVLANRESLVSFVVIAMVGFKKLPTLQ